MRFVIVGIGINVNQERFPPELAGISTSLRLESGRKQSRLEVLVQFLRQFERDYEELLREGPQQRGETIRSGVQLCAREARAGNERKRKLYGRDGGTRERRIAAGNTRRWTDRDGDCRRRDGSALMEIEKSCCEGVEAWVDGKDMLLTIDVGNTNTVLGVFRESGAGRATGG